MLRQCLAWVQTHAGHALVYGFLYYDYGRLLRHVRFVPHVVVQAENGEWLDLQAALKLLGQDEIDDAHALMRDQGFRPDDFAIIWDADPPLDFASAVTVKVTLVEKAFK